VALVCGPEIMMRFAAMALRDVGVPAASIHLSLERNMKCGLGHCGRCQLGPLIERSGAWALTPEATTLNGIFTARYLAGDDDVPQWIFETKIMGDPESFEAADDC